MKVMIANRKCVLWFAFLLFKSELSTTYQDDSPNEYEDKKWRILYFRLEKASMNV